MSVVDLPETSRILGSPPCADEFEEERLKRRLKERLAGATLAPVKIDRFVILSKLGAGGAWHRL